MYSVSGPLEWVLQKVRAGVIFGVRIIRLPGPSRGAAAAEKCEGGGQRGETVAVRNLTGGKAKMSISNVRKCGKRKFCLLKKKKKGAPSPLPENSPLKE